jgi:hypothetical protein
MLFAIHKAARLDWLKNRQKDKPPTKRTSDKITLKITSALTDNVQPYK